MSKYPESPLATVLVPASESVDVADDGEYPAAGIYSFARGLFRKPTVTGLNTTYKQLNRLREGQIVYSRLFGWEGAIAYVTSEFDGFHVSHEFPVYDIEVRNADPNYIRHVIAWPVLHSKLSKAASGMGSRRQRVRPEQFLSARIPPPDLKEQRRIADKLDMIDSKLKMIAAVPGGSDEFRQLAASGLDKIIGRWAASTIKVNDACTLVNDIVFPGDALGSAKEFVGLEHIAPYFGLRVGSRPTGEERGRKFRFAPGDVLYGYLRPYLNKVWLADRPGLCSVEQYVLRPNGVIPGELLAALLRGRSILHGAQTATHNLQLPRLRSGLLMAMEIPFIPSEHHQEAISAVNTFMQKVLEFRNYQNRRDELAAALRPAILNAAFSGHL